MSIKLTGSQFFEFWKDQQIWGKDDYVDDCLITFNGQAVDADLIDSSFGEVLIESGRVESGIHQGKQIDNLAQDWLAKQSIASFLVQCPKERVDAVKNAVIAAGGTCL